MALAPLDEPIYMHGWIVLIGISGLFKKIEKGFATKSVGECVRVEVLNLLAAVTIKEGFHFVVTPCQKFISLLLCNCDSATVMNHNMKICFLMVL